MSSYFDRFSMPNHPLAAPVQQSFAGPPPPAAAEWQPDIFERPLGAMSGPGPHRFNGEVTCVASTSTALALGMSGGRVCVFEPMSRRVMLASQSFMPDGKPAVVTALRPRNQHVFIGWHDGDVHACPYKGATCENRPLRGGDWHSPDHLPIVAIAGGRNNGSFSEVGPAVITDQTLAKLAYYFDHRAMDLTAMWTRHHQGSGMSGVGASDQGIFTLGRHSRDVMKADNARYRHSEMLSIRGTSDWRGAVALKTGPTEVFGADGQVVEITPSNEFGRRSISRHLPFSIRHLSHEDGMTAIAGGDNQLHFSRRHDGKRSAPWQTHRLPGWLSVDRVASHGPQGISVIDDKANAWYYVSLA